MNKLVWIKDSIWKLYVNDKIIIEIKNDCPNAYNVWTSINDCGFYSGFYNNLEDAQTRGLKVAQAILEED